MTSLISPYILFFKLFPQDLYVYEGNKRLVHQLYHMQLFTNNSLG